jgi:hypothetical protein
MTDHLLDRLKSAADWRRHRIAEDPQDSRHKDALRLVEKIAEDVKTLGNSAVVGELEQLEDHMCELLGWELAGIGEEVKEYEHQIGFRSFPQNATEYVDNLIQIYRRFLRELSTEDQGRIAAER